MKVTFLAHIVVFVLATSPASAREPARKAIVPGDHVEEQLDRHGLYLNSSGLEVHAPANHVTGSVPDGASGKCRDGSYSFSHSRSGACSRHGGIVRPFAIASGCFMLPPDQPVN